MCSSRRRRAGDDVGLGTVGVPAGWRGGGDRGLCCLMSSESFGCHGPSRHRWGGSAGEESCCFGLSERGCLGHCGGCRRRLDALHEGGVLLEEGWGYCG